MAPARPAENAGMHISQNEVCMSCYLESADMHADQAWSGSVLRLPKAACFARRYGAGTTSTLST